MHGFAWFGGPAVAWRRRSQRRRRLEVETLEERSVPSASAAEFACVKPPPVAAAANQAAEQPSAEGAMQETPAPTPETGEPSMDEGAAIMADAVATDDPAAPATTDDPATTEAAAEAVDTDASAAPVETSATPVATPTEPEVSLASAAAGEPVETAPLVASDTAEFLAAHAALNVAFTFQGETEADSSAVPPEPTAPSTYGDVPEANLPAASAPQLTLSDLAQALSLDGLAWNWLEVDASWPPLATPIAGPDGDGELPALAEAPAETAAPVDPLLENVEFLGLFPVDLDWQPFLPGVIAPILPFAHAPQESQAGVIRVSLPTWEKDRDEENGTTAVARQRVLPLWGDPADADQTLYWLEQQVRRLERRQASLNQFFSPVVRQAIRDSDPDQVLSPRETDVTVLFGDLRGFSRAAEKQGLTPFLDSVSQALGTMTRGIQAQEGVIGDFHGDATMGFWGWPTPQADRVARAARAAVAIRSAFAGGAGFSVGIGIASGRAIAGKIGTDEQVKVTVFGPVVNLASRLEGMTKLLRVPVLLDEATAQTIQAQVPESEARLRRLAVVRPCGMDVALTVYELLPPAQESTVMDSQIVQYEAGLTAFLHGNWATAYELLMELPAADQAREFLMNFIAQHDFTPPAGWNGVITLTSKG